MFAKIELILESIVWIRYVTCVKEIYCLFANGLGGAPPKDSNSVMSILIALPMNLFSIKTDDGLSLGLGFVPPNFGLLATIRS